MTTYVCGICRVRLIAGDTRGRKCPGGCGRLMVILQAMGAVETAYRLVADTGVPFLNIQKYHGQVVLALIDGKRVQYKGQEVTDENVEAFYAAHKAGSVSQKDYDEYNRMLGERDSAESLHEKRNEIGAKHLCIVEDYEPNTEGQRIKIREALNGVPNLGQRLRLYIVGHSDPDSRRMAGLDAAAMAQLIATCPRANSFWRITLVGCHTSGEAQAATGGAAAMNLESFASQFHSHLGKTYEIYAEVAGYTTLVKIRPSGKKAVRFKETDVPAGKLPGSKVLFYWNIQKEQQKKLLYHE